jgi:hypothetical protein
LTNGLKVARRLCVEAAQELRAAERLARIPLEIALD